MTHHLLVIGDSRHMEEVESESIKLMITSPPYWNLKKYGIGSQNEFFLSSGS